MVPRRHNPLVLLSFIVGLGGFLSVVPRRHSPLVLLSFIVGLGGLLSVVPRQHSPPVIMYLLSPVALAQLGVPCLCKQRRY